VANQQFSVLTPMFLKSRRHGWISGTGFEQRFSLLPPVDNAKALTKDLLADPTSAIFMSTLICRLGDCAREAIVDLICQLQRLID
jgi:hypothetical protein